MKLVFLKYNVNHWICYEKRKIIYQRHIFFKLELFVLFQRKAFLKKFFSNMSNIDRYFCYLQVRLPVNCLLTGTCIILLTCKWKLFPGTEFWNKMYLFNNYFYFYITNKAFDTISGLYRSVSWLFESTKSVNVFCLSGWVNFFGSF